MNKWEFSYNDPKYDHEVAVRLTFLRVFQRRRNELLNCVKTPNPDHRLLRFLAWERKWNDVNPTREQAKELEDWEVWERSQQTATEEKEDEAS